VPGSEWDGLAALPVDAVWLMGVWQRSPIGRAIALGMPELLGEYRAALTDLHPDDVIGSPYCVREYVVDERFGGPGALAAARAQLADRGLALILDYVPNHVAVDHPWVSSRPDCFVTGSEAELVAQPKAFTGIAGRVFAKGRDPYFEPWQDVLQLNAFSPALRDATADAMTAIGDQCDGVRCDMAMLMTNEVFARTWDGRAGPAPPDDFWPAVISRCRQVHPALLFIAEVYWDMEWALQQQGFDLCYDKRLYDRLVHDSPESVRAHLRADSAYQQHMVRFIENHDEERAAVAFEPGRARAAAVVISTLQGAHLYHDGQLEGFRTRLPVQLGRAPDEPPDHRLRVFYERLLRAIAGTLDTCRDWCLCDCTRQSNESHHQLLAWCWSNSHTRHLVVVNFSPTAATGRVRLPWEDLTGRMWSLADRLSGFRFNRSGDDLAHDGLSVWLDGWGTHLFELQG
jgi:hypothetical protein